MSETNKPSAEQLAKFKQRANDMSLSEEVRAKFRAIVEKFEGEVEGEPAKPAKPAKATRKPRATKEKATTTPAKRGRKPASTSEAKADAYEKAKADLKKKTGKTEEECEAIIDQYRELRAKAQTRKAKEEEASKENKKRVEKLERKGDLIEGTSEKTADAVIESTTKDVVEKIEKQIEAVEEKAEKEAKAEVAKDKTIKTPKEKKEAVEAKVEKKVAEKTKTIVKRVVIDTSELLTSIATSLGKFDKDSQKEFLIKLRSDIDKLLSKYAFGGMTDGATQVMNIQQSNLSASSVNPTLFAKGGGVGTKGRYHILGSLKGKKPLLYAKTDDKKEISKLVKQAEKDFFDLTGKKHTIFVTDSVTDDEVYHYAKGGGVASRTKVEVGDEKIAIIKNRKEVKGYPVYVTSQGYAPITIGVYETKEKAEQKAIQIRKKNKYEVGGVIGQEIVFDDNGEENTGVIKDITNLGDYVVTSDDGRTLLAQRELDVISLGAMRQQGVEQRKKRFGFFGKGGSIGSSAKLRYINDAYASYELQDELREKLGIDENAYSVGDNVVISFAYTDYGGDFLDKVAIEYFKENYPENILSENTSYSGENAFVFGEPAQEWIDSTEDYPLGFEDFEYFYFEKMNEAEYESFGYFLDDLERDDYTFDNEEVMSWLMENKGGYYSMTTQGLDFSYSDLTDELIEEGLISKEDEDDEEYAKGGGIKDVIVYDNQGETFDRYTIFTPDGSVYGMSDNALMPNGFNMYIGDDTEIEKGSHLGKRLKSVPESIKVAVERRMSEEYAHGGLTEHGLRVGDKITRDFRETFPKSNEIGVLDEDNVKRVVNLDRGTRMAKGGNVSSMLRNRRGM